MSDPMGRQSWGLPHAQCGVGPIPLWTPQKRPKAHYRIRWARVLTIGLLAAGGVAVATGSLLTRRIAPHASTNSEDGAIIVNIPLHDLAAEPDARPSAC
jgi:hypothetical protein